MPIWWFRSILDLIRLPNGSSSPDGPRVASGPAQDFDFSMSPPRKTLSHLPMTGLPDMPTLTSTELKRLHRDRRRETSGRIAMLLDSVQTPYNVGSILRSAAAFGVEHLWLVGATESPTHPKTQKTALGSQRFITWTTVESIEEAVTDVHSAGFRLVGIELAVGAVPMHELKLAPAICLAVGHEDRGLSKTCLSLCDDLAYIPQIGAIGSLNVATAASIALYEARRQEWNQQQS